METGMLKEKKIGQKIILAVFICCIVFPWPIWFVIGDFIGDKNNENREMTARPQLSLTNYGSFADEYESYFNDTMPFRSVLISLNKKINYFVFHESTSSYVILGKDGWLFYADTLADYQRYNLYTDEELETIKNNVLNTKTYFDERGIEFIIFVAPNKSSIYGDYMPDKYEVNEGKSRTEQVISYLRNNTDVTIYYPKDDLLEVRNKYPSLELYLKLDTHWNYMGGYFGSQSLLKYLGADTADFSRISYEAVNEPDFFWNGYDMANMLGLADVLDADLNYHLIGYSDNTVTFEGDVREDISSFNGVSISTSDSRDNCRVFFARDSFGEAMSPYLSAAFSYVYSPHISCMTKTMIEEQHPDIFIYEFVERTSFDVNIDTWAE